MAILPRASSLVEGRVESVASAFFGDREAGGAGDVAACDRATLESMYGQLAPRILRFQRDLLGDPALAFDATQETFIRAFRRVAELPAGTRLVPWVFGIARNVSLELRRARGRARKVVVERSDGTDADVADPASRTPEAELLDREALRVVERALEKLSEDRRSALVLRLDHGLSYDDVAAVMGWSLAKTKVEIFRAREVLRATFEEYRGGQS